MQSIERRVHVPGGVGTQSVYRCRCRYPPACGDGKPSQHEDGAQSLGNSILVGTTNFQNGVVERGGPEQQGGGGLAARIAFSLGLSGFPLARPTISFIPCHGGRR